MNNLDYDYDDRIEDDFDEEKQRELDIINEYEKKYGIIKYDGSDEEIDDGLLADSDIITDDDFEE